MFPTVLKNLLLRLGNATDNLKSPTNAADFLNKYQKEHSLKARSLRAYLSDVCKFIRHVSIHYPEMSVSNDQWQSVISEYKEFKNKEASRETILKSAELFKKVPDLSHTRQMLSAVMNLLREDLQTSVLSYMESAALTMYAWHVRLNCRPGPILNLTVDHYNKIKDKPLDRDIEHKTDYIWQVVMVVPSEIRPMVEALMKKYRSTYGRNPTYVISSSADKPITAMAELQKDVFKKRFGISGTSHNPTSNRKMWDTEKDKDPKLAKDYSRAHQSQTGNSDTTRQRFYQKPCTDEEYLGLFEHYNSRLTQQLSEDEMGKYNSILQSETTIFPHENCNNMLS